MKHKFVYLLFFLTVVVFSSCEKNEEVKPLPEPDYPTTYKVLSQNDWDAVNAEFKKVNIHDDLYINKYGFVEGEVLFDDNDTVTATFIVSVIKLLINNYSKYFGIPEEVSINVDEQLSAPIPYLTPGGSTDIVSYFQTLEDFKADGWHSVSEDYNVHFIKMEQNKLNDRILHWASLYFSFYETENRFEISGNWWPKAFVPETEIYSEEEAYLIALDKIASEQGENSKKRETVRQITKVLCRNTIDLRIEIRECWSVYIKVGESSFNHVFVDTQTGEVIRYWEHGYLE